MSRRRKTSEQNTEKTLEEAVLKMLDDWMYVDQAFRGRLMCGGSREEIAKMLRLGIATNSGKRLSDERQ